MPLFGVAVFFAAGGEQNARGEDRDDDRDDDKRGSDVHRAWLLAGFRVTKQLSVLASAPENACFS